MTISFTLPEDLEARLRQSTDLGQAAKEALLVELYRQQKISIGQFAHGLGISRIAADGVLKQHKVYYEQTYEDVIRESELSRKLREQDARRS